MSKTCKICNKKFSKSYERGFKSWAKAKFCSSKCKKLAMVGQVGYWRGKKRTYKNPIERARKISQTMKGKRPHWLDYQKKEKHPSWKDGRSDTKEYKHYIDSKRKSLKKSNGGYHTFAEWETLKAQYNWTCPACKRSEPDISLTVDHIIPLIKGGSSNIENIQPLCHHCNSKKHTKTIKYEK